MIGAEKPRLTKSLWKLWKALFPPDVLVAAAVCSPGADMMANSSVVDDQGDQGDDRQPTTQTSEFGEDIRVTQGMR